MDVNTFKYIIYVKDTKYYCKVVEMILDSIPSYTISVGGKNTYCFIASMSKDKNYQPYIDRIEYENNCMNEGDEKGDIVSLVNAALWTMKILFQNIKIFNLMDDSYIYCQKESRMYKMSLAYDYIIKYNQTWYENKFNAYLPDPYNNLYKNTLNNLDNTLQEFHLIRQHIPELEKYETEYKTSNSPREFIEKLRLILHNQYCFNVGLWLSRYMEYIGIDYFKKYWKIDADSLIKPNGFQLFITNIPMKGGFKRRTRTRRVKSKMNVGYYGEL